MKPAFVAFSCLLIATISCKKTKEDNDLCFTRASSTLKIENHTGKDFHFAAFNQNILPFINWGPFCNADNKIPARDTVNVDLSANYGYSNNDSLVVYWWECTGNTAGEIQYVVLDKNQMACK